MNSQFYQDRDFSNIEIATVLEDFHYKSMGKFYLNTIIPELDNVRLGRLKVLSLSPYYKSGPYEVPIPKESTSHIINYNSKHGVQGLTESNYVLLHLPSYLLPEVVTRPDGVTVVKNQQVLVAFVGGEVNNPRIIGAY